MLIARAVVCFAVVAVSSVGLAQAGRSGFPVRDAHEAGYVTATELADGVIPGPGVDGNFIVGPTHKVAAEAVVKAGVPQGDVYEILMNSEDSRFYPGIAREPGTFVEADAVDPARPVVTTSHPAAWTRTVAVYVPKQYVAGSEAPFIVGADGPDRLLFTVLDNLIAAGKVPAMVAISIQNGGGDAQGSERGLEYDTISPKYADWVEAEVLPRAEAQAHVRLTRDPEGRAAMGGSSGGACALIMAWYRNDLYHRVLAYSGTWINQQWPYDAVTPHGAWEFPEHLIGAEGRKPIRIWMEVGDQDLYNPNAMRDGMHDWVQANERMAAALGGRGYHYQFVFAKNSVHVDGSVRQQTLAEALEYLWRGYRGRD